MAGKRSTLVRVPRPWSAPTRPVPPLAGPPVPGRGRGGGGRDLTLALHLTDPTDRPGALRALVLQLDFKVLETVAKGTFGVVYRVVRKTDGRQYALKQIDLQGTKRAEKEEAIDEARVLSSLDSPYVIKYYDCFMEDNKLNIVMELAEKGTLYHLIGKQYRAGMPEAKVWKYFIQALIGLRHIHSKKIIHRDIKTLNLMLDKGDNAKIGDLGIARVLGQETLFVKTVVGTPYYLSPELCEDKPYNEKSDIWALGVCLYEFCTGKHPFEAQNEGALIRKIMKGAFTPVQGYSPELCSLSKQCLTFDHKRRPDAARLLALPTVQAKIRELGLDVRARPGVKRSQTQYHRAPGAETGAAPAPPAPEQPHERSRSTLAGTHSGGGTREGELRAEGPPERDLASRQRVASSRQAQSRGSPRGASGAPPLPEGTPPPAGVPARGASRSGSRKAPFGTDLHKVDPYLAYALDRAQIDDDVTARVRGDVAAERKRITEAVNHDNMHSLLGGYQSSGRSGLSAGRLNPSDLPPAGAKPPAPGPNRSRPASARAPFASDVEDSRYRTHAQELADKAAENAVYEPPRFGRKNCPDIQITGPSLRAGPATRGGRQVAGRGPISSSTTTANLFASSYTPSVAPY